MSFSFAFPCVENIGQIEKALRLLQHRVSGAQFNSQSRGNPQTLVRYCVGVDPVDPLAFLSRIAELGEARCYFEVRDKSRFYAGIGRAVVVESKRFSQLSDVLLRVNSLTQSADITWFGGIAHADTSAQWQGFPAVQFVLPLIELRSVEGQYQLAVNLFADTSQDWLRLCKTASELIGRLLHTLAAAAPPDFAPNLVEKSPKTPALISGHYSCCYRDWESLVTRTLQALDDGQLQKVVLARSASLHFEHAPDVFTLLSQLQDTTGYQYVFENQQKSFFGCSPERLFLKHQQQLFTESLAGTVGRGNNALDDKHIAADLLNIAKLVNEHQVVTDGIRESVAPLAHGELRVSEVDVIQFAGVQHAYQTIEASLKSEVTLLQIISNLHPTPAVCGYPQQHAADFILENENLHRSWYAGAVGVISADCSEFAVSIRSGLCEGANVELFSGVGIVKGSEARQEWSELNAKLSPWLNLLGVNESDINAS